MKLPFSFSLKLVFRLVVPGFVAALALRPALAVSLRWLEMEVDPNLLVAVTTLVLGWVFVALDMPIYMLFEGRRFWPGSIWRRLREREERRLGRLRATIDAEVDGDQRRYLEASVEIRRFPLSPSEEEYEALFPTRLGNLLTAYEAYPLRAYGMDSIFYWPRLWVLLDKDLREEIDDQQAVADSALYVTAALSLSGLVLLAYTAVGSFVPAPELPRPAVALGLAGASFLAARLLYLASLHVHAHFGELFKAVFDVHRSKIQVDEVVSRVAEIARSPALLRAPARVRYVAAWNYLHNFRVQLDDEWLRPREVAERLRGGSAAE